MRIGTAGWGLPRLWRDQFPPDGSYLERYAARFSAAEINSSFYRQHRRAVYERWASAVPASFRFAVKLPRAVTHDQQLVAADVLLEVFLDEVRGLGDRLGPLLVQLPPSLAFDAEHVDEFLGILRGLHAGAVACEPRHETWFTGPAEDMLRRHGVARAAADPARVPAAAEPGGDCRLVYYRLHGSPRMYYSDYEPARLAVIAERLGAARDAGAETWCIFDNTTLGAATGNALALARMTMG
ncbi:MAG TPA: DUF72 domain-containing protein [Gemmatimonadaceae bacterium]|nr:DUF72 domain-containing protein [Gemmatimonadaceae bacterium]